MTFTVHTVLPIQRFFPSSLVADSLELESGANKLFIQSWTWTLKWCFAPTISVCYCNKLRLYESQRSKNIETWMTQNGMSLKATRPMTPCCNLSLPCTHPRCPNRAKKRLCPSWLTGPQSTTVQEWRDEDDLGGLTVLDPSPGAAGGGTTEASWVVAGLAACDCLGNSGRGGLWIGGVFSSSKGTVGTGFESIAVAAAGKSACSASGTGQHSLSSL